MKGTPGKPTPSTLEVATKFARVLQKELGTAPGSAGGFGAGTAGFGTPVASTPFMHGGTAAQSAQLSVGTKGKHKILGTVHSISSITGSGGGGKFIHI